MRFLALCLSVAVFGLTFARADVLQFSAITDMGEIASFTLDSGIPNTYDPILYPNLPIRGVYLSSVHDLNFENTHITVADVTTSPGMTGDGRPLTIMQVGPLFDLASLHLSLLFLDPTLVSPLQSDPAAYERSFVPFQSVLFPQIPPSRTHVDPLLSLAVRTVQEPAPPVLIGTGIIVLFLYHRTRKRP
jgi:hypothetical protein